MTDPTTPTPHPTAPDVAAVVEGVLTEAERAWGVVMADTHWFAEDVVERILATRAEAAEARLAAVVRDVGALADGWDAEGWDYPAGAAYDLRAVLAAHANPTANHAAERPQEPRVGEIPPLRTS